MDAVMEFLRQHFEFVLRAGGLLVLVGAIHGWKWLYAPTSGDKTRHAFIFEVWGEQGYRVFIGLCGATLIACGIIFLIS